MTEAEWLSCTDPRALLEFALASGVSDRRLRLFLLACCRRLWGNATDGATRVALACAERFVEASLGSMTKTYVKVAAGRAVIDCGASDPIGSFDVWGDDGIEAEVYSFAVASGLVSALDVLACNQAVPRQLDWVFDAFQRAGLDLASQAELFHDIIRAPFRSLVFPSAWRTRNDSASLHIAQEIDRDQAFDQLPLLADALMDVGCDNDEILRHLQRPGTHVRGCWALDLVLKPSA
jgi:hypothetical protein